MSGNSVLNNARYARENTDEWYTSYEAIAEELSHYEAHFHGKSVLCNCDNPFLSNFCRYFLRNFNKLRLKRLVCTSYGGPEAGLAKEGLRPPPTPHGGGGRAHFANGLVLSVTKVPWKDGEEPDDDGIMAAIGQGGCVAKLKGDGDFRSQECVEYLKGCDICCTNPPFSLFAELFALLVGHGKEYLLLGNQNAITYKEIFPYIKANKAWLGYRFGDMAFRVPADSEPRKTRFWVDADGQKWRSLGNVMWLTNLDIPKRREGLTLTRAFDPEKYPKYDNFDGIDVKRVADIPYGYAGVMGVPITYMKHHNGAQFEIVGEANHGTDNEFDLFKPKIGGKALFKRILIRRRVGASPTGFRVLDLFCGAGGMSWGMHKNPHFETVAALDFDARAAATLKRNMPNVDVVVGDITDPAVKERVVALSKRRGVNMVVGGPPCQGYSMKGKKLGLGDPRNFLFREYLDVVRRIQPDVFVVENVQGLLLSSGGWFRDEIVRAAEGLGYAVRFGVLDAAGFGVPQARKRAIFICSKHGAIPLPAPPMSGKVTVRDAIGDLAYLESGEGGFEQEYVTEAASGYQKQMRAGSAKLYNHQATRHRPVALAKLRMIPPEKGKDCLPEAMRGAQKFKATWGRLKWGDVSPTIDTRFDTPSNGSNSHPCLDRAITPREAARLQSFDDAFVFLGPKVCVRKQIGNAVPPLLAKAIADQVAGALGLDGGAGGRMG